MRASSKRIVVWTVVGAVLGLALVLALLPRPLAVDLITVGRGPMMVTVAEEGQTRVHDIYVLSAPVAGQVQRISAHPGDVVVRGETVLARIEPGDPSLLDPRSEAQAKAQIHTAESARNLAQAELEQAAAELTFAENEWRRANELVVDGTISRRAMDEAERGYKTALAAVTTARAALQMRLFELEQTKALMMSPSTTQGPHPECDCVPITAPIDGRVLRVINASARVVQAGDALIEIGDPKELEVVVDFLSVDAVQMSPGQAVIIDGWGGQQTLAGRIKRVEPFGYTKVSALGIEEQRVNVVIDLEPGGDQRDRLGHGYQVQAQVVLWQAEDALTVPLTALLRHGQEWAVFVQRAGRAELQVVQVGQRNGVLAEIKTGLSVGERVVVRPNDRIIEGGRVVERVL